MSDFELAIILFLSHTITLFNIYDSVPEQNCAPEQSFLRRCSRYEEMNRKALQPCCVVIVSPNFMLESDSAGIITGIRI